MNIEVLNKLHDAELDILLEMDRICKQYGLRYSLIGGTLLGAIRHGGFIPWDDDIDIVMPREDYNKFREIAADVLDSKFFLDCPESDELYPFPMPKVRMANTAFVESNARNIKSRNGIYLDIFLLDRVPKEKSFIQKCQSYLQALFAVVRGTKLKLYDRQRLSVFMKMAYFFLQIVPNMTLYKWQQKIQTLYNSDDCNYYVNFASQYGYIKQTMKKDVYFPSVPVQFETFSFNGLSNVEYYLNRIYGPNFLILPPIEKRITHNPIRLSFDLGKEDENLN